MKNLLLLISFLFLVSCGINIDKSEADYINDMKCPVIMIAESAEDSNSYACITLQDSTGYVKSFVCKRSFSVSIASTYNVGDTIVKCK